MVRIRKWSQEDLAKAISDHKNNKVSIYKAAKDNGVPYPTLRRYLKSASPEVPLKVGKHTTLSPAEEEEIAMTCDLFAGWGFGISKAEVVNVVSEFFVVNKRPNPFKNNKPGPDWWSGFMRRHPSLAKRKPQPLQIVRARAATARLIDDWFDNCLQPALTTLNLIDKPSLYFQCR